MPLEIHCMNREEVGLAVEWAAREGWNPGLHDAECFYAADPRGFFLARRDGEPVGALSAVAYDERFGFAGFYIVKPGCREQGIGHALAARATAYMGNRVVGNDAVVAQQETYKALGFVLAYRNIRYRGMAVSGRVGFPGVVSLSAVPFADLAAYDRVCFPAPRAAFLKCWISRPDGAALGFVESGRLTGYGVLRKCRQGYKIGPLFAESEDIAETLFSSLTRPIAGEEFFLDIPEPNEGAGRLVRRHAMDKVFETARMYRKEAPSVPLDKIYGVTSFELG